MTPEMLMNSELFKGICDRMLAQGIDPEKVGNHPLAPEFLKTVIVGDEPESYFWKNLRKLEMLGANFKLDSSYWDNIAESAIDACTKALYQYSNEVLKDIAAHDIDETTKLPRDRANLILVERRINRLLSAEQHEGSEAEQIAIRGVLSMQLKKTQELLKQF